MLAWMTEDFGRVGVGSPRLDAELLLSHALSCERVRLYMETDRPLDPAELDAVRALVKRRRAREPVAYILGRKEFYKRPFLVTRTVLIPRPETEILVDRALEALPDGASSALDLCTGSGAIAITLAAERPELTVVASDLSDEALEVAGRNAEALGVADRVQLRHGDLFQAVDGSARFDLITINPPYVAEGDWEGLAPEITRHEPRVALTSGPHGLDLIRRFCSEAPAHLAHGGALLIEVGAGQAETVAGWLQEDPQLTGVQLHDDLAGVERVVQARRVG
jgi:release factor glutamine methyltransferase